MNRPLWNTQNDLAEKIRTGAVGTARTTAKNSRLSEYPLEIHSGHEHVTALSGAIATFGASARAGIAAATELGDADTADLFTEISRSVDKRLWKVEAHGQGKD
jgi:starvation-inducible DNA-binding protein